ncbi:MAG: calcium/sodium antiporter [Planctomycetales bacterium]|nr:calcium/sodium antiporter [Planctomycetales bacterium]
MNLLTAALFVAGFFLLIIGADVLVRGASRLAVSIGVTPLVVAQTVVAYGTSAPELAVSIRSSLANQSDIAVGNIIGSNISNILLVLGITAMIRPIGVSKELVKFSVPVMIVASIAMLVMGLDGTLSRAEGILLLAAALLYSVYCIVQSRRASASVSEGDELDESPKFTWSAGSSQLAMVAIGIALLVLGATWLVDGAVMFARLLGVSELLIGLTIIAVGTSLPEIATSILAGARGKPDIALGNAIGSNIFNILLVLGACATVTGVGVPIQSAALRFDIPVMLAVAAVCLPIFYTGMSVARWEGALFLGYYAAYVLYLILQANEHDALDTYSTILFGYLAPLTLLTLGGLAARSWMRPNPPAS